MIPDESRVHENVAEYILLIYQLEDVVRAYDLDLERLKAAYIDPQVADEQERARITKWYSGLIDKLKRSGLQRSGHIPDLNEIMVELSYLHNTMINLTGDTQYKDTFEKAVPYIEEFRERSDLKNKNQIELAFHAMYMKLLLRLQKKDISTETEEAFEAMRKLLAHLSSAYKKMKSGDLNFLSN
ncbi:MAG: DUF4924 family protein [Bacteroidetes bacterium]|nr:MAG: DUF4924 family protein [Bacteroidota bacterium]